MNPSLPTLVSCGGGVGGGVTGGVGGGRRIRRQLVGVNWLLEHTAQVSNPRLAASGADFGGGIEGGGRIRPLVRVPG